MSTVVIIVFLLTVLGCVFIALTLMHRQEKNKTSEIIAKDLKIHQIQSEYEKQKKVLLNNIEHFQTLFNGTKDMVFLHGITPDGMPGPFINVNDTICSKLAYTREIFLTMTPLDIEYIENVPAIISMVSKKELATISDSEVTRRGNRADRQLIKQILKKEFLIYERVYSDKNGKTIPVEVESRILNIAGTTMIMSTAHDITKRKASEKALIQSEQRFQNFFAKSTIGVAMYNYDKELIDVNHACLKMFGIPDREEFVHFNLFDNQFMPNSARKTIAKGNSVRYEATVDFKEVKKTSLFVSSKTGTASLEIFINNMGLDSDYKPKGYLVEVHDITAQRKTEEILKEREKELQQSKKMEAIGTLAGGIAHDFNNILTPILGYAQITMRSISHTNAIYEYMQEIIKGSHRAKDLIEQILTFSRRSDAEEKLMPIKIIPIVKEVLKLINSSLPSSIEIKRIIKTDRDTVLANPTQIHQIIMNLCTNAIHVMRDTGGILEVRMTDILLTSHSKNKLKNLQRGKYLHLSIKDTGSGIDKATLERIFEPFFTTKKRGEGTGMGLAVVHGIVTALKGSITVDTKIGEGTTFNILFPTIEPRQDKVSNTSTDLFLGTGCVLIVDDESDIIKMETHMLSILGYEVTSSTSSLEALDLFKKTPDKFNLVITDQVMAEMSGAEFAKKLLTIRPELPIICCSGFSEAFSPQQAKSMGIREFIKKPIEMEVFAEAIHRAIELKPM